MAPNRYSFRVKDESLYIVYSADYELDWLFEKLESGSTNLLGQVFTITEGKNLGETDYAESEAEFPIGKLEGEYFKLEPVVLSTKFPVFIHKEAVDKLEPENFFVKQPYFDRKSGNGSGGGVPGTRYIPIFPKLEKMFSQSLMIGGEIEGNIPIESLLKAIKVFPDTEEVKRYMDARIAYILGEYVIPKRNYAADRDRLVAAREARILQNNPNTKLSEITKVYQTKIFEAAYDRLEQMLNNTDDYVEAVWQDQIMDIILLLYPKYIHKEKTVKVTTDDSYGLLDIAVFDAGGFIDVIEIKKPIVEGVGVLRKTLYRNNYVPSRELSGAIMQIEKYTFWLTRWGKEGERVLQRKYGPKLPVGLKVRIASPGGIIIFGRDNDFDEQERQDFEIIKRKYKHVGDMLTYDDLLRRLSNILKMLKENSDT